MLESVSPYKHLIFPLEKIDRNPKMDKCILGLFENYLIAGDVRGLRLLRIGFAEKPNSTY